MIPFAKYMRDIYTDTCVCVCVGGVLYVLKAREDEESLWKGCYPCFANEKIQRG